MLLPPSLARSVSLALSLWPLLHLWLEISFLWRNFSFAEENGNWQAQIIMCCAVVIFDIVDSRHTKADRCACVRALCVRSHTFAYFLRLEIFRQQAAAIV